MVTPDEVRDTCQAYRTHTLAIYDRRPLARRPWSAGDKMSLRKRHPCAQQTHGPGTQACAPECAEAASVSTRAGRAFHADTVACTIQSVKLTGRTRLPDMIASRSLRGRGGDKMSLRKRSRLQCTAPSSSHLIETAVYGPTKAPSSADELPQAVTSLVGSRPLTR